MPLSGDFTIKDATLDDVDHFLQRAGASLKSFRYFDKRPVEIINTHLITIVVMFESSPVGYGHLDKEDEQVWLGICVAESFGGKGIGNLIMNQLLTDAQKLGVSNIALSVDSNNRKAFNLYRKFGFRIYQVSGSVSYMKLSI